jgi:GTPase
MLNYKDNDLKNILENSAKLVSLIDLAGDRKYLKTTIYGLSGYNPHYCSLLINARIGWTAMSNEHWCIASAFNIPVFLVITKIDLVSENRVQQILAQIQTTIECNQKRLQIKHILTEEDAGLAAGRMLNNEILPVFSISNVTVSIEYLYRISLFSGRGSKLLDQISPPASQPNSQFDC